MLTNKNDRRFAFDSDADAREKMTAYIEEHFSELLGDEIKLLNLPNGLDILSARIRDRVAASRGETAELLKAA